MTRYVLEIMYDGTRFHGSQVQGETPTVQLYINKALATLFRKTIETTGASRTDEGVHALCNYYHFDMEEELHPELMYRLNAVLPEGVAIKGMYKATNPEFNARFEAVRRRYRYRIYKAKNPFLLNKALFYPFTLNEETLNETAAIIKDHTQFESFCKRNAQVHTFNCTIHQSYWERHDGELHYIVEANRFLRGMVRGLVATQIYIARGRGNVTDFKNIIDAQNCTKAYFNVAGHGLYLENIAYPEGTLEEITKTP